MSEGHVHLHKTGHSWIDLSIALCAIVVSIASLAVAVHHGHAMEKLVTASSLPYVQLGSSNTDDQGNPTVLRLHAINGGTGPARIAKLVMSYEGKPVTAARQLLAACCAVEGAPRPLVTNSNLAGRLIVARGQLDYLVFKKADVDPGIYARLEAARPRIETSVCYCSVFDECWIAREMAEPVRVADCSALEGEPYLD